MMTITIAIKQLDDDQVGVSVQHDPAQLLTATLHEKHKAMVVIESIKAGMLLAGQMTGEPTVLGMGKTTAEAEQAAMKARAAQKGRN